LQEYSILLAQLEHQFLTSTSFTLQTLLFHLQTKSPTLNLIYSLTTKLVLLSNPVMDDGSAIEDSDDDEAGFGAAGLKAALNDMKNGSSTPTSGDGAWEKGIAKGGEVLSVISDLMESNSGNPVALSLYSELLLRASQPYATILLGWISTGHLVDPFEEFIVKESKSITRIGLDRDFTDTYWDGKYTLRDAGVRKKRKLNNGLGETRRSMGLSAGAVVPSFLEKWKVKILLAGKYLNVIRECGIEIKIPDLTSGAIESEVKVVEGQDQAETLMALNDES
jgi:gamma-tubulin complex component 2